LVYYKKFITMHGHMNGLWDFISTPETVEIGRLVFYPSILFYHTF